MVDATLATSTFLPIDESAHGSFGTVNQVAKPVESPWLFCPVSSAICALGIVQRATSTNASLDESAPAISGALASTAGASVVIPL